MTVKSSEVALAFSSPVARKTPLSSISVDVLRIVLPFSPISAYRPEKVTFTEAKAKAPRVNITSAEKSLFITSSLLMIPHG